MIDVSRMKKNNIHFNMKLLHFAAYGKDSNHCNVLNSIVDQHFSQYKSFLNAIYGYLVSDYNVLKKCEYILFRDGLYTLCHLFAQNDGPPGGIKPILRKELITLLPKKWISRALFYGYVFAPLKENKAVKNLFIYIQADPFATPLQSVELLIAKISEKLEGQLDQVNINVIVKEPIPSFLSGVYDSAYLSIFYSFFEKKFKKLNFLYPKDIYTISPEESMYVHFNPRLLLSADSYVDHMLMSRGVTPFNLDPLWSVNFVQRDMRDRLGGELFDPVESIVWLSPYHGVKLYIPTELIPSNSMPLDFVSKIRAYYSSSIDSRADKEGSWDCILNSDYLSLVASLVPPIL